MIAAVSWQHTVDSLARQPRARPLPRPPRSAACPASWLRVCRRWGSFLLGLRLLGLRRLLWLSTASSAASSAASPSSSSSSSSSAASAASAASSSSAARRMCAYAKNQGTDTQKLTQQTQQCHGSQPAVRPAALRKAAAAAARAASGRWLQTPTVWKKTDVPPAFSTASSISCSSSSSSSSSSSRLASRRRLRTTAPPGDANLGGRPGPRRGSCRSSVSRACRGRESAAQTHHFGRRASVCVEVAGCCWRRVSTCKAPILPNTASAPQPSGLATHAVGSEHAQHSRPRPRPDRAACLNLYDLMRLDAVLLDQVAPLVLHVTLRGTCAAAAERVPGCFLLQALPPPLLPLQHTTAGQA